MMKYLVVEDKEQEEDGLLYDIADFLWNNENEVYISNNYNNRIDYQNIVKYCDCIVLLIYGDCLAESFFESEQEKLQKYLGLEKSCSQKLILVFSINGVYSNVIPYPHKIFHFQKLGQHELARFFSWCRKLNLFVKQR